MRAHIESSVAWRSASPLTAVPIAALSDVTAGRCDWLDIHPDTAAWMDDGMFARTLLSMWPRLVDLRAEILRRLSPRTLERLALERLNS